MTAVPDGFTELYELAGAQCDARLTAEQAARLEELVLGNADQRLQYIFYMHTHAHIEQAEREAEDSRLRPPAVLGSPLFTVHALFCSPLFSYTLAAMILGAGLIAARLWRLADDPQQLVASVVLSPITVVSAPATPADIGTRIVGKITGLSKCQWANPDVAAREAEPVPLGRTYAMTAGLLEITYNIGTKVILEGPVVFSADRFNGGALRLGKLTVVAPKLDRARLAREEQARNHPLPPARAPAFNVRTPAAMVIGNGDRDVKFGVEVCRSQTTYARVFQGPVAFAAKGLPAYALPDDYCVWTGAGPRHDGLMLFRVGHESATFALELPESPPVCATPPAATNKNHPRKASSG